MPAAVMASQPESLCRTVGFTPRSAVVGATPAVVTFQVTASGCSLRHWELSLGPYDYYTYLQSPRAAILPRRDTAAGPQAVLVDTCNSEFDCRTTSFPTGFTLKRRTTWQTGSFDATPEPVRKGAPDLAAGPAAGGQLGRRPLRRLRQAARVRRVPHADGLVHPGRDRGDGRHGVGQDHRPRQPHRGVAPALRRQHRAPAPRPPSATPSRWSPEPPTSGCRYALWAMTRSLRFSDTERPVPVPVVRPGGC